MNLRQLALTLFVSLGLFLLSTSAGAQQIEIKGPKNGNSELSGSTYGPVTPADTLWRIASRYRQNKNLSVYQIMQGIYQLNPDAFEDNNFNHLKDGSILNLPSERYIARIDGEQARIKAESDDSNWSSITQTGEPEAATKSRSSGVASKDDLSETKQVIEDKLSELDAEQNRQFMAIRQQFSESISAVQSVLGENRQLLERLDGVDQDISELRGKVDVEIQTQMDQMLELQNELLKISKDADLKRQTESAKSSLDWLTDPIILIALTVLLSLSLLAAFAFWLVRKSRANDSGEMVLSDEESHAAALEQSDEMDELAEALSNELSDELVDSEEEDLFADEELLDDVLSEELKESLDETADDDFENFDDLGDENLEPIIEESDDADVSEDELLEQEDLDSLFDEDDDLLAQIDEDAEDETTSEKSIDTVDDADELLASTPVEDETAVVEESEEIDEIIEDVTDEVIPIVEDEQDKPEISIDELLEQPEIELPDSVIEANSDLMNDEMLQNLDKEISQQNEQLDSVADNLLSEIEQLEQMSGLLDGLEEEPESEEPLETNKQHSIQELESVTDDIEDDFNDDLVTNDEPADDLLASLDDDIPTLSDIDSEFDDNELEEALKTFDEDIIDSDSTDQEQSSDSTKPAVELDDLPGLGDWLTDGDQPETEAIDELESSSFDELLDSIEEDEQPLTEDGTTTDEQNVDESGLDFDALLTDIETTETLESEKTIAEIDESKFVDVEDLINESEEADEEQIEKKLNLEAAFSSYEGLPSETEMIDVDGDKGIGAKLDLAQAYIETDEIDAAKTLLQDVIDNGDDAQRIEAKELLEKLT